MDRMAFAYALVKRVGGVGAWKRALMVSVAVGLALAPAARAGLPDGDSVIHADAAQSHLGKGEVSAAIIELKNAIRADANNLDARYQLAMLYLRTGDGPAAQQELETARSRGYSDAKVLAPLAQAYFLQGKYREIVTKLDAGKLTGAPRGDLLAAQARAQIALQDRPAARVLIDQALKEDPMLPSALVADALLLRLDNKLTEASNQVDKALAKDPGQPEAMVIKGELLQAQGDNDGAVKYLDGVVQKYPSYARAYIARAIANVGRNQIDSVRSDVATVLAAEPKNLLAIYLQGYLLERDGKHQEATQLLLGHPQLLSGYAPANYVLASAAFAGGHPELGLTYAQSFVDKMPEEVAGVRLLAAIQQRLGNSAKAVALLESATAKEPADGSLKLQLADAYLANGQSENAVKLFQQGVAADPNNVQAQYALAVSQLRAGAKDQAAAQLEKTLALNPSFIQANAVLVMMQLQDHNTDKALTTTKAMIAANASDPNGYNLQGTVYIAAGNTAAAAVSFKEALTKDPKFTAASLNLARLAERSGDRSGAKDWYQKTLSMDPRNIQAAEALSTLALNEGDSAGAVRQLEEAIKRNPDAGEPRVRLVDLHLAQKDPQQALIVARDFANTAPDNLQAAETLGRAQIAVGDYVNGIGSFQRVTARLSDNAEAYRRLGSAYAAAAQSGKGDVAGSWTNARVALDKALSLAPDYPLALSDRIALERVTRDENAALALAHTYATGRAESAARLIALGDEQEFARKSAEALASYRAAWAKAKSSAALHRLHDGLMQNGSAAEAVALVKGWAAQNPSDYDARFLLASDYIAARNVDAALAETEGLTSVVPDNPALLNNLAWLYGEKNDPRSIQFAEHAYALAPQSPDVADTLGWLQFTKGDAARGATVLTKAHELAPERQDISYHYAAVLKKTGNVTKARVILQKALTTKAAFTERAQAEALLKQLGE